MRGYILILVCGIVVAGSGIAFAQPRVVDFCYWDDGIEPPEPPITDASGQPVPDGTLIKVMHDLGQAGPDPSDTLLAMMPFNGEYMGIGAGYFFTDQSIVFHDEVSVYVAVPAASRCWYTVTVLVPPGASERCFSWTEWTMAEPPCPWNAPTVSVTFWYCIHPPWYLEQPLGCPCDNPVVPESTIVAVMNDINGNGPDGSDTTLSEFVALENVPDCIWVSPEITFTSNLSVYLQIGFDCCWRTNDYLLDAGQQSVDVVWSDWSCTSVSCALSTGERPPVHANDLQLKSVYPNPFNASTRIEFTLPVPARVEAEIFNLNGQHICTLADNNYSAGTHALIWDARTAPSGIYLCRVRANGEVQTQKLLLLR